jgi:tetrahydromethanopterin S-methyltransferase subunit F
MKIDAKPFGQYGHVCLLALLGIVLTCQAARSQTSQASPGAKSDPCKAIRTTSYGQGWTDASTAAKKSSEESFKAGWDFAESIFSVKVSESGNKQRISLVVEDIDGADSYRFAAAEVIKTHFSDWLEVDPLAPLSLHIAGTKLMRLNNNSDVQSVSVEVNLLAEQNLIAGQDHRLMSGLLQLANAGSTLAGYSPQEKTQEVRELIYKVLSSYREGWDKAGPKSK